MEEITQVSEASHPVNTAVSHDGPPQVSLFFILAYVCVCVFFNHSVCACDRTKCFDLAHVLEICVFA